MRLFPGLLYEAGVHTSTPASTGREATLGVERRPAAPPMLNFWCYLSLPQRVFPVGNSPPPWKWPQRLQKYALSVGGLTVAPGTEICFQHRKNKITSKAKASGALAKFVLKVILEKATQAWKRVSLGKCCNIVHRTHSHLNQCHQFTCGQEH